MNPNKMNPNAKKPLGLVERLNEAAKKAQQAAQEDSMPPKEDLNILPFPLSQQIKRNDCGAWLQWEWEPVGMGIKIIGLLYTQDSSWPDSGIEDKPQGHYEVQLSLPTDDYVHTFDPVIAKGIGQSLIAAWNWKDIWKEHAGTFLEKELFGYGTE